MYIVHNFLANLKYIYYENWKILFFLFCITMIVSVRGTVKLLLLSCTGDYLSDFVYWLDILLIKVWLYYI